jgi:uncharacterized cupredoxin-like copper-binding protein
VSQRTSTPATLRRPASRAAALVIGVAAALLTACGGSNSGTSSTATTTSATSAASSSVAATGSPGGSGAAAQQSLTATEVDFKISLDKSTLTPGAYSIRVVNNGNTTHAFNVEENGKDVASSDPIQPGQSTTLALNLVPAQYSFYCPIDNHRAMGMQLNVTVQ